MTANTRLIKKNEHRIIMLQQNIAAKGDTEESINYNYY